MGWGGVGWGVMSTSCSCYVDATSMAWGGVGWGVMSTSCSCYVDATSMVPKPGKRLQTF